MSLTTEQITSQTFPQARRGYNPAAVDRFLERIAKEGAGRNGKLADVGRRRDEIIAEARLEAEQLVRDAEAAAAAARDERDLALADIVEARAELENIASDRSDLVGDAGAEADRLIAEAKAEAEAIVEAATTAATTLREEATAELEVSKASRWEDVGDRVSRILTRAEDEAAGLLAEATEEAEALTGAARAEAQRTNEAADGYAAKVRKQAEEWAQARLAAARDDRAKAGDVLEVARTEAQRTITEAEGRAADHLAEADEKVRLHVADLLAGARYDLDRLRSEEAEAAETLTLLTATAQRVLDERARTAPAGLGAVDQFVPRLVADVEADPVDAGDQGAETDHEDDDAGPAELAVVDDVETA